MKPPTAARQETREVRLAEVLATLSLATDLAMSFPPEMALRTCLLAIGVGRELGVRDDALADLYYVSLLRHIGCTAFSHEEGIWAGDDNVTRRDLTGVEGRTSTVLPYVVRHAGAGRGPVGRLRAISGILAKGPGEWTNAITAHCDASARLAGQLGMSPGVIAGLNDVFERWDGKGLPRGLRGDAISLAARLTSFSHTVVVLVWRGGTDAACEMARRRAGGEFDPAIAAAFLRSSGKLLEPLKADSVWDTALEVEPVSRPWLPASQMDRIASAFASFTDLKSPFLLGHSRGVAELAEAGARVLSPKRG